MRSRSRSEGESLTVIMLEALSGDDLDQFERMLGRSSTSEIGLDVIVDLTHIEHLSLDEVRRSLELSRAHSDRIKRVALVMEDPWSRHVARLGGRTLGELLAVEAKEFRDERDARKWLAGSDT